MKILANDQFDLKPATQSRTPPKLEDYLYYIFFQTKP